MVQMLGWFRAEAALASRRKRSRACGSAGERIGEEFQGDEAIEQSVLGFVDDAHSAAAETFEDAEVRNGLSDERVWVGHGRGAY